jgi:sugar lactone lactonase YvrE
MSALFSRKSFCLGILCLFLLTAATVLLVVVPAVNSAVNSTGGAASTEIVLRTATDSVLRLSMTTNEIIYNPQDQRIYATRPSSVGNDGNSITRINPLTGEVGASVYVGSEPNKIALSDNGQTVYVSLDGAYAIRRYDAATHTPGAQFSIGRGQSVNANDAPYRASAIAVAPGNADVVAVSRDMPGISPPGAGVAIYNNGVRLPLTGNSHSGASNYLAYSSSATTLYGGGYDEGLRTMTITANGVTENTNNPTPFAVRSLKFENNLIFTSTGQIINPETRTLLGTCAGIDTRAFVPDTATGRVLYAVKEGSSSTVTIRACDINTFTQIGSLTIPNVGYDMLPTTLVRYGTNGLAMRTSDNQIYFIQTALIPTDNPLPPPSGTPTVTPTPTPTVFARYIRSVTLPNKDLIYSRTEHKFYASVPNTAPTPRANSVTRIEPTTGAIENSVVVGSQPDRLALSDDDQTLYVGINGTNSIRKFDVQTQTPGLQFPLGNGVNGPKTAFDIEVLPNNPNAVAVSYGNGSYNYDGVDIYDDGVKRAQKANASGTITIASPDTFYIGEYYVYKYGVGPNGFSLQGNFTTNSYYESQIVGNTLYTAGGTVLDLATAEFKGTFTGVAYRAGMTVDVPNNRIFFLVNESIGYPVWSIKAYRLDNFLPIGSIPLPGIGIFADSPRRLIRWGENGLAFNDYENKIYFIQTNLVSSNGIVPTTMKLGAQTYTNNETDAGLPVTVLREGGLTGTTTVNYTTVDGTATAGTDYTAATGTLSFAPGESSKTINIPIINDNVFEGNETLSLVLSNPNGGQVELLDPTTAALTIIDNESQPSISTPPNLSVSEPRISGTTTALFTVQLSNATTQTATVNYSTSNGTATAGVDYVSTSGTLTFAPLETTKTIAVDILADQLYTEPNEYFFLTFNNSVNSWINNSFVVATIINYNPQTARHASFDFDDDGKTDIAVFRPSAGEWWINRSSNATGYALQFGAGSDRIVPADYTGDGKTDVAFFRPSSGEWFVLRSEDNSFYSFPFGASGDIPVPSDYDGDGKVDAAVFRPSNSTWYVSKSTGGTMIQTFGQAGDVPVTGDYDGDNKADLAVYRVAQGEWWINRSSNGTGYALQFGSSTDKPVQGDYTGDGKDDVAFWRPSTGEWFVLRSQDLSFYSFPYGASEDTPAPGDYDGDGKYDAAVFRPSNATWYVNKSTGGNLIQTFGQSGDVPVPNAFVP